MALAPATQPGWKCLVPVAVRPAGSSFDPRQTASGFLLGGWSAPLPRSPTTHLTNKYSWYGMALLQWEPNGGTPQTHLEEATLAAVELHQLRVRMGAGEVLRHDGERRELPEPGEGAIAGD